MFTFLFVLLMFAVFGKIIFWAIRATWGITKILFGIVFLPFVLICLVIGGLLQLALPLLVIIGIVALVRSKA